MNWLMMTAIMTTALTSVLEVPPAKADETVRYIIRFPDPQTHYVSVEAVLPVAGEPAVEVFMPVWTPGSYLVRDYARNIEAISVSDSAGKSLVFSKSRTNRWRVETGGAPEIRF